MPIIFTATNKKQRINGAADIMLQHQAFDNSFQPNIISIVSTGKIIVANNAACRLLGYSKKELLTKSRSAVFDITESNFKKMLKQRTTEGHSIALVTAIKKSGKRFPCEITSALFTGEHGVEKSITTISDRSQTIRKQKNIDVKKEKIVADNIVLAKSKQKKIDIKKDKVVADNIVLAISKQKNIDVKKEKVVADNIVLAKSKQKRIDIRKEKIVASNIVLAISKQKNIDTRKEKILANNILLTRTEYEDSLKLIFTSSSDILYDCDLIADEVIISDAFEKEFGYKITSRMTLEKDWASHIHPGDREAVYKEYLRMLASEEIEWKYSYRFLRADGSVADVLSCAIVLRNAAGKAYRIIGSMEDISKQKVLEESVAQEIKLREKQIEEAIEDARDMARADIGKELHDKINQLLTASRMYLLMAKGGGEGSEMYIGRSSEYTLMAIEEIRKLTRGLTTDTIKNLGLCEAIENTIRDTMEISPVEISCNCNFKSFAENNANDKFKMNIFRIVQEQLNNILKHANATKASITLSQNKKSIKLTISDNGAGFDTTKKQTGIGISNIKSRATSYNGTADFVSEPGKGCILTVVFPVSDMLLNKDE